jgi:hypothetical protein
MLVSETQNAGYKSVIWNATNDQGRPVSTRRNLSLPDTSWRICADQEDGVVEVN